MSVLIIDNYDSFTHNLAQRLGEQGARVEVVRNDAVDVAGVRTRSPSHIVLSPGPGRPDNDRDFGVCGAIIDQLRGEVPILGVCLGHQGIAHRLGGQVVRAPAIVHGKTSALRHSGTGLFRGLPQDIDVMRYHSLMADRATLPAELQVVAETADGLIMAVAHEAQPLFGLQFHPESIGTPDGAAILANFLAVA